MTLPKTVYTPELIDAIRKANMTETVERGIGDNMPPPDKTPFDESVEEIDGLYGEAKNWADGTPISRQDEADMIGKLISDLRAAGQRADDRRATENKPFDEGKSAVQAKYAPLIADTKSVKGKVPVAIELLKAVNSAYLVKKDAEKRAEAELARKEAEAFRAAADAAFAASAVTDLAAREEAERLAKVAKDAEKHATRAEKDKAVAKGGARAMTLRTVKSAEVTDMKAFAAYVWTTHHADLSEFLTTYASELVRCGVVNIPGVNIKEERVAQ